MSRAERSQSTGKRGVDTGTSHDVPEDFSIWYFSRTATASQRGNSAAVNLIYQQTWVRWRSAAMDYQKCSDSRVVTEQGSRNQAFPGCGDERDGNKQVTQKHPLKQERLQYLRARGEEVSFWEVSNRGQESSGTLKLWIDAWRGILKDGEENLTTIKSNNWNYCKTI